MRGPAGVQLLDSAGQPCFWVGFNGLFDEPFHGDRVIVRELPSGAVIGSIDQLSNEDFAELFNLIANAAPSEALLTAFVQEQDRRIQEIR